MPLSETHGRRHAARFVLERAVAAFLILLTPFFVFLQYHSYPYVDAGTALCVLALAMLALGFGTLALLGRTIELIVLAGLLTVLADLQFHPPKGVIGLAVIFVGLLGILWALRHHAARIVTLGTAAVLLSSVLLPSRSIAARADRIAALSRDGDGVAPRGDGALIVHLILDEQIGVEGFPADFSPPAFRSGFRSFFTDRGFLVFGRAFSEYSNTYRSIGALLNFRAGEFDQSLVVPGRTGLPWDLTSNAYFAQLAAQGYAIRVYQPDYLNFCGSPARLTSCYTYPATSLAALPATPLSGAQKASIIASMYLDRSHAYAFVRQLYNGARSRLPLPPWNWERNRLSPISTMGTLAMVRQDLSKAHRGEVVFAHLLLPHYPYVYDRNCGVRPPREWLEKNNNADAFTGRANTPAGRRIRYQLYEEQVECVQRRLDHVFRAIPPALQSDAIIIVQGDHGSRIMQLEPTVASRATREDYIDNFSTLFAIKSPWLRPGYDRRMASITCLMRMLGRSGFRSLDGLDECTGPPTVFAYDESLPHAADGDRSVVPRALMAFGEPPDEVVADGQVDADAFQ